MKRFRTFLLLSVVAMFVLPSHAQFAHTRGTEIIGTDGKPIFLHGTNLGNWFVPEGYMWRFEGGPQSPKEIEAFVTEMIGPKESQKFWNEYRERYITEDDIRFIRTQGFNVIRVPLHWKFFQNSDSEGFRLLDRLVLWCRNAGLYVVLDLHAAPGGQTGTNIDDGHGYPWLFLDSDAQQQTVDLWKRIANHYRNEHTVLGYDLMNEPIPNYPGLSVLHPALEPLCHRIVSAIRSVDKHHIVILEGAEWAGDFSVFGAPFDANAVYEFHKYWKGVNQQTLQQFIDYRTKYSVPIWLGESGENTDLWVEHFRTLLEANHIPWTFWPYKKMEATSAPVSFAAPKGWDQIVAFAKLPRGDGQVKARQSQRPPQPLIESAFKELLDNIQFQHCTPNPGYIRALLPSDPGRS